MSWSFVITVMMPTAPVYGFLCLCSRCCFSCQRLRVFCVTTALDERGEMERISSVDAHDKSHL